MTSSVDGLVSGLSTTSMINSLIQAESAPQTALKTKVSTAQKVVGAYQSVNSKLSALKGAADDLGQLSTWRAVKPTSSSTAVTATATGGTTTATGSLTFDVVQLARAQTSKSKVPATGPITTADSISVTIGNAAPVAVDISKTDKSAQAIADAVNAKGLAVRAAVVTTGGAQNVLQFTGTKSGVANTFDVTGLTGVTLDTVAPLDAKLQVGGADADGGFAVTSASNTFTGLIAGVSVTVGKVETGVSLNVTPDVSGMAGKLRALVDAANGALSEIGTQTAYDAATKKSSTLTGDFMVRQMSSAILGAVSTGLKFDDPTFVDDPNDPNDKAATIAFGSLSKLGISLNRSGRLTFDESKFTAAYNADPTGIKQAGIALGDKFEDMAAKQSTNVTSAITGRKNLIDSYNIQISNWDARLAAKRETLVKQYAGLETSLGKLKEQSSWLAGQIASLG